MSAIRVADRVDVPRNALLLGALVVNTHVLLLLAYYALTPTSFLGPTPILVPLIWIGVGVVAVVATDPPEASQRNRTVALAVATAYFGLLAYLGGIWGPPNPTLPVGVDLAAFTAPPGWAPRLYVNTPVVQVHVLPFKVVGYLALAYLVYATVLEAAGSAITGVVGLLSCVSCTWPVIATVAAGVTGGTAAVVDAATAEAYPLSTLVFVVTVALLYWRPGWR